MLSVTASIKQLGIDRLDVQERLALIGEIWDSVAKNPETVPVPEAHRHEVQRRLQALATDRNAGRPADDVLADIQRRL